MSRTTTLTNMLLDVRTRTNQENSTFVTDTELTGYLNQELAELWTKLVLGQGQPFYRSQQPYAITPTTSLQPLPADFWAVQEVTATVNGGVFAIMPFMPSEHGALQNASLLTPFVSARYRVQAGNIEFLPASQAFTATLYYSPSQPRLVNGSDVFDGFNGYEEAAICGVCAIVMAKEESDPSFWLGRKQATYATIDAAAAHRDMANPERVQDVMGYGGNSRNPFGWWVGE